MYALIAFEEGYKPGNVWEVGPIEKVVETALLIFRAYGFTPEKANELMNGRRIYLSMNPYGADYIQAFIQYNPN